MYDFLDRTGLILGNFMCLTMSHTAKIIMTLKAIPLVRAIVILTAIPLVGTFNAESLSRVRV